jgi:hypothetical protein
MRPAKREWSRGAESVGKRKRTYPSSVASKWIPCQPGPTSVAEAGQEAAAQLWDPEERVEKVEAEAQEAEAVKESVTVAVEASVSEAEAAMIVGVASAVAIEVEVEAEELTSRCCWGQMSLRWTWKHLQTGKERPRIRQLRKRKRSG